MTEDRDYAVLRIKPDNSHIVVSWHQTPAEAIDWAKFLQAGNFEGDIFRAVESYVERNVGIWHALVPGQGLYHEKKED